MARSKKLQQKSFVQVGVDGIAMSIFNQSTLFSTDHANHQLLFINLASTSQADGSQFA
jgi:hypothetical protein